MLVWSRNAHTGDMGWKPVLAQYSNPYEYTVSVEIRDLETGSTQRIVSNRIHPYFVQTNERVAKSSEGHDYQGKLANGHWVDAANLKAGYRLLNADESWSEVVSVEIEHKALKAYNLTVADYHTYFVSGDEGVAPVWVHNNCFDKVDFNINRLPDERQVAVNDTLSNINMDTKPNWLAPNRTKKWGSEFQNKKGDLPEETSGGNEITYKNIKYQGVRVLDFQINCIKVLLCQDYLD